ncbi:hypothetical protein SCUP515_03925 [Seiridium cupressi]
MSWKLTKKLKETHLGPPSIFSSRTTSTSTITDKDEKLSAAPPTSSSTPAPPDNAIAASESMVQQPVMKPPKPGILVVTLHEGHGFALPEQHRQQFASQGHQGSVSSGGALSGSVRPGSRGTPGSFMNGRPQTSGGGFQGIPSNHGRFSSKYLPYALLDFDKVQVFVNSVSGNPENPLWAGDNTQYKFDVSRVTELAFAGFSYNRPIAGLGDAGGSVKDPSFVGSIQDRR